MTDSRTILDRMVDKARAEHDDPEIARRALLEYAALAEDDVRDEWAMAYARQAFDDRVRNSTLRVEKQATTPSRVERRSIFSRPETPEEQEVEDRFRARISDIMDDLKSELHMEWTRELLDSSFALGDGTFVTWGDATVDQHEARIQMHSTNAEAALEGWARHSQAIDAITDAGASCLNDIEGELAA